MEQDLARTGFSLPEKLLGKFDEIITKRGYSPRSEGIRDVKVTEKIMTLRGVKHVKLTTIIPEEEI